MKYIIAFGISAFAFAAPIAADAAPVTWDFVETACSGCTIPEQYPHRLAALTLPGPDSSGDWPFPGVGDPFSFVLFDGIHPIYSFQSGPCCAGVIRSYDVAWTETAGNLLSVSVDFTAAVDIGVPNDAVSLALTSGTIFSKFGLDGCVNTQCSITGFWQSELVVPEPMSAVLLLTGLLGLCLASSSPRFQRVTVLGWAGPCNALVRPRTARRVRLHSSRDTPAIPR